MTTSPDFSTCPPVPALPCSVSWPGVPRIVAEALAPVPDPVVTALRPGPWASPGPVARALARALLPDEDACPAPDWLLPAQVSSFRRAVAALRRFRGALLADPVGSGKTYVALAVASELAGIRPAACLVPAALLPQWKETAARLSVRIALGSHEQASRGRLPEGNPALVVIDEAHRFRHPGSRRYRRVAPWLVGRKLLLVTATPIVNRLTDLLHQLRLGIRDDALLPDGVPSLRALLVGGSGSPALGRLVIERVQAGGRPRRRSTISDPSPEEEVAADEALELIDGLRLSRVGPVASLVRSVLRHAASSSPAALVGALERYRGLLLHARDALAAGRPLDRASLRRFTGEAGDQLCWWELLPAEDSVSDVELDLSDLSRLEGRLTAARRAANRPDPKVERLRALLSDGVPTLVFVARRETVRHLRNHLANERPAWCTGRKAGLGSTAMPRSTVLRWFRTGPGAAEAELMRVRHLIVTEVAAEGLDLQRAARVVHYDLPWTPMRMEQREGRAVRLGSSYPEVEIVRFPLPPSLERVMRMERTLERKRQLPAVAGLGAAGRRLWRWRTELGESLVEGEAASGVAMVRSDAEGVLAGYTLFAAEPRPNRLAFVLAWIDGEGRCSEDDALIAARLAEAVTASGPPAQADPRRLRTALDRLAGPVRARLASLGARRWAEADPGVPARRVAARLLDAVRGAARQRDLDGLYRLERALGFVAGGHTAGETMLLDRLAGEGAANIARAAPALPAPTPRWGPVEARLEGMLLFVTG